MCVWYTNVFSSCCTICKEFPRFQLNACSMEQDTRYQYLDGNNFCKAQILNVNSWPSPFHSYIIKTNNTVTIVYPPYFRPHTIGYLGQNDHFMLTQACHWVLGHKVPGLRHLYKPIGSKINQNLKNSPKIIDTNYNKNYMFLLKLLQITPNNPFEQYIYILYINHLIIN